MVTHTSPIVYGMGLYVVSLPSLDSPVFLLGTLLTPIFSQTRAGRLIEPTPCLFPRNLPGAKLRRRLCDSIDKNGVGEISQSILHLTYGYTGPPVPLGGTITSQGE
jgi:hypothetical protein